MDEQKSVVPVKIDEKEFSAAEQDTDENIGIYVHTFKKPFAYEGKTYDTLTFDWDSLTGKDSLAIENELNMLRKSFLSPEFSGDYLVRMAARACTEQIGIDVLLAMPLNAYTKIRSQARYFLLMSGQ